MPRKPTRLYMFDVAFHAIRNDTQEQSVPGWILIPSGQWRVAWAYGLLVFSSIDVVTCSYCVAFCRDACGGAINLFVSALFVVEMALNMVSAFPSKDGGL